MLSIEKARLLRDNQLGGVEKCFKMLCIILNIMGFGLVLTGSTFISNEVMGRSQFGLDRLKLMAAALIVSYIIITWVFGCVGIVIALKRDCSIICLAIYGTLIFLFVAIPLMAEGDALRALKHIKDSELDTMCKMPMEEVRDEYGGMVYNFMEFAHRFDSMSE